MVSSPFDTPFRRDVALGLLALGLLTAPVWASALSLGEPTVEYDRVEVTTTETGIEYADEDAVPSQTPISDEVDCAGWHGDLRACAFETRLHNDGHVPTEIYTTDPTATPSLFPYSANYYDYVQLEGQLYGTTITANESAQRTDGMYRADLALEPADPNDVLGYVSVDADDDDLPSVLTRTARYGTTTTRGEVDVPAAPIEVDDGTYYRVYQTDEVEPPGLIEEGAVSALTYIAPLLGVLVLFGVSRRFEVSYVGTGR